MPVIVVGADTPQGRAVVEGLVEPGREIRAFVSDPIVGAELREIGVKVALGDVSDDSHIQGSCTNCFTAVLVTEAARDGRERAFAANERQVLEGWASAAAASGVTRVIWIHEGEPPPVRVREVRTVSPEHTDLVGEVAALDDARFLPS
ncbi:MAG TPA: NAD(P)H-binding protein [Acidimicrobiia bacterium]|jgi:nucleoside-diphosphate-sugar epimerase|nr:NAD(P)H-binding protein [Acidimicrobiia bacterium]